MVCLALTLLTKEEAVAVLPMIFAVDVAVAPALGWRNRARALWPFLAILAVYLIAQYVMQRGSFLVTTGHVDLRPDKLVLGTLYRLPELFIYPRSVGPPVPQIAVAILAAVVAVRIRREPSAARLASLGMVMAFLALLPSSLLDFNYGEHRYRYLASTGVALVVSAVVLLARSGTLRRAGSAAIWVGLALLLATQGYKVTRMLRYWDRAEEHARMSQSIRIIAPELVDAVEAGRGVRIVDPPLPLPHIMSLVRVYAGVPLENPCDPAAAVQLLWDRDARRFLLRPSAGERVEPR